MKGTGYISQTINGSTLTVNFSGGILNNQGTWSVISKGNISLDSNINFGYAVNNKGIFLIGPITISDSTSGQIDNLGTLIYALKK